MVFTCPFLSFSFLSYFPNNFHLYLKSSPAELQQLCKRCIDDISEGHFPSEMSLKEDGIDLPIPLI